LTLAAPEASAPAPSLAAPKAARNQRLDILRGIAVLFVLNAHNFHDEIQNPKHAGFMKYIGVPLERIGWTGVDLFFVLSGFLVGGLLFHEIRNTGTLRVRRFLIRRGFKIWPSYFAYLAVASIVFWLRGEPIGTTVFNLLHVQNYFGTPFGHTWSLAVEEHFYIALPLLLMALLAFIRKAPQAAMKAIPIIGLALIIVCTATRILCMKFAPDWTVTNHHDQWPTHIRIDSLFVGVTLAYFHHYKPQVLRAVPPWLLAIIGFALISPMAVYPFLEYAWIRTVGYTMLYFGYGSLLIAFLYSQSAWVEKISRSLPFRGIAFMGFFSYSIYLWHEAAGARDFMLWLSWRNPTLRLPSELLWVTLTFGFAALATVVGVILGKLIELPFIALRNKLFPPSVTAT
jgi:peptidoglycan/LPS O-acetylase OafA/YrhL